MTLLKEVDVMLLIKQSWVTGKVKGVPYRGLLNVELNTDGLTFGLPSDAKIINIPKGNIQSVKQIRNIFEFGLKIKYLDENMRIQIARFRTRKYKQWSLLFESIGVPVIPHGGWMEIV